MINPGSFATTSILTKGLHGGPAYKGLITTFFSLYVEDVAPPPPPPPPPPPQTGGGGPYPGPAHNVASNISGFYKPVDTQYTYIPKNKEAEYLTKKRVVKFEVKVGSTKMTREYLVPDRSARAMITIIDVINSSRDKIKITIKNIRTVASMIKVSASNLIKKRD